MVRDTLIKMRELLAEPEHWTKGAFARDVNGIRSLKMTTPLYVIV